MDTKYFIENAEEIITPQLVYYKDFLVDNIKLALEIAGNVNRLWPHVKSHKMLEMVKLQQSFGIKKFKCATIAEAEMLGDAKVEAVLLAYPLVGPNKARFISLIKKYPQVQFFAIGDDYDEIANLGDLAVIAGKTISFLVDVNLGMNRTGVSLLILEKFYRSLGKLPGIEVKGLHCYDGDHHERSFSERLANVKTLDEQIDRIRNNLVNTGLDCSVMVMGGTPSFPCHAKLTDFFLSPGTCFINDAGYSELLEDMPFVPAAAIITRVVSRPGKGFFTLDLGYKGIASDPVGIRGKLENFNHATSYLQNEEHWIFKMDKGFEDKAPDVGDVLYVIPTHICPTTALYNGVPVVQGGKIIDWWLVTARNRKITV